MKTKSIIIIVFLILNGMSSCSSVDEKNINTSDEVNNISINVNKDFFFETTQIVKINIFSTDFNSVEKSKIEIYSSDPEKGGSCVKKGITNNEQIYYSEVKLPSYLTSVFIKVTNSDNSYSIEKVNIVNSGINYSIEQTPTISNALEDKKEIATTKKDSLKTNKFLKYLFETDDNFAKIVNKNNKTKKNIASNTVNSKKRIYLPTLLTSNSATNNKIDIKAIDVDSDGVINVLDDFPADKNLAFNNYYPSKDNFSTLIFGNIWNNLDDDFIIDYNINPICNSENKVAKINITLKLKSANYLNKGFGIELDIDPNLIAKVSGDFSLKNNIITDEKNLESNQTKAVIIFFSDASNLFTEKNTSKTTELKYSIELIKPVDIREIGQAPYNPFVFINNDRKKETHLSNHPNTDLASSNNKISTNNNYPLALNIYNSYNLPIGEQKSGKRLNQFTKWVESGGNAFPDWYQDKNGYRKNNIY